MHLPEFLIVGAMKSGTSKLSYHLRCHSKIHIPEPELFFFAKDKLYYKGLEWYNEKLNLNIAEGKKIVGEKSNSYSYNQEAAARISKSLPDVKLIWIFRNPVDRAFSNYIHAKSMGWEFLSFEKAIEREPKRIKKNIYAGYTERGKYAEQVKRFCKYIPLSRMHFIVYEEFVTNTQKEMMKVFDFLGVENEIVVNEDKIVNEAVLTRFSFLLWLIRKLFGRNIKNWNKIKSRFTKNAGNSLPQMKTQTRDRLTEFYRNHNLDLQNLINKDLSCWNNAKQ